MEDSETWGFYQLPQKKLDGTGTCDSMMKREAKTPGQGLQDQIQSLSSVTSDFRLKLPPPITTAPPACLALW